MTIIPQKSNLKASYALAAAALLTLPQLAVAANDIWIGNTDANFATLSNWTGSVNPNNNTPVFGTAGSSGTTLNNGIVGASYAGMTFNAGASAFTIGGNSFTLTGNITNNSSNLQTINNDMTSTAARTFTGNAGGLTLGGAYNTAVAATYNGVVNIKGAAVIDGGAGNNQGFATFGNGTNATVTISNGGSINVKGTTGAAPNTIIGQNANSTSALNVGATDKSSSGTLTIGGNTGFVLGNNNNSANGSLNIYSGTATIKRGSTTATDLRSYVSLGRDAGNGTINLNGGTLATDRNFVRDSSSTADVLGSANFVFGGGTLQALANQTDWLNSSTKNTNQLALTSVTTTSADSTIDSNGFTVAINSAISGTGGFKIISSTSVGTVTFGGSNSYTGKTEINSGTLSLSGTGSISNSSAIEVASGAHLDVSAHTGGSYTIASGQTLAGKGAVIGNITVAGNLAPGSSPGALTFNNNLTLSGTTTMEITNTGTTQGTDYDAVLVGDTLAYGGDFKLTLTTGVADGTYFLFDGTSGLGSLLTSTGNFGTVSFAGGFYAGTFVNNSGIWTATDTNGSGQTFTFDTSTGDLMVVPEPGTVGLLALGLFFCGLHLLRRRPASSSVS